jgi:hypothetical protein
MILAQVLEGKSCLNPAGQVKTEFMGQGFRECIERDTDLNRATGAVIVDFLHSFFARKGHCKASQPWESGGAGDLSVFGRGAKDLQLYDTSADRRACPFKGMYCGTTTFGSYRQMLAHCRQKHPDRLSLGGDHPTEITVTDIQGKVLSCDEMRQIIDDPAFWRKPPAIVSSEEQEEVGAIAIQPNEEMVTSESRRS